MIRERHDLSREEEAEHLKKFGHYNDFPPNWREISEAVFAKSAHFTYTPWLTEYRQMLRYLDGRPNAKEMVGAHLHYQGDGTGYAVVNDFWAGKVRFYAFGCAHEWGDPSEELKKRGIRLSAMETASYCKKCGHLEIHDTSD